MVFVSCCCVWTCGGSNLEMLHKNVVDVMVVGLDDVLMGMVNAEDIALEDIARAIVLRV